MFYYDYVYIYMNFIEFLSIYLCNRMNGMMQVENQQKNSGEHAFLPGCPNHVATKRFKLIQKGVEPTFFTLTS